MFWWTKKILAFFRRILCSRFVKWFLLPLCVLFFIKGCVYEPYIALNVEHTEIPVKKWDDKIPDIKIGIVTDLHAGDNRLEKWRIRRIVEKLNAEEPDIVFLLGDFVNGFFNMSAMPPDELAQILSGINAPLGKFAVTGNHDLGYGANKLIKGLAAADIKFLNNESVKIKTGGNGFYVAGMSFRFSGNYNTGHVLSKLPEGAPVILLIHSPEIFPALPEAASVIFAGHTHGGQVRLPIIGALTKSHTMQPVNKESGLVHSPRGVPLYVSPGVGNSTINLRLFCPPQIEIITLKAKAGD